MDRPDDLGLIGDANLWAGTIVRGRSKVELDGWISGYAVAPRGGRDLLLGGPAGPALVPPAAPPDGEGDDRGLGRRRLGPARAARWRAWPAAR